MLDHVHSSVFVLILAFRDVKRSRRDMKCHGMVSSRHLHVECRIHLCVVITILENDIVRDAIICN